MCGRVRLGTDFSQIRIKLKFDAAAAAPNVPASWIVCSTERARCFHSTVTPAAFIGMAHFAISLSTKLCR
jgi:hypothetical protein